ncbi:deoxyribose-phosphate aldolase, partial [Flavobacteriaceae bacterium]|nr:deoxyribose-phosphate aldolase [Flavobacteriaceae bacterium]
DPAVISEFIGTTTIYEKSYWTLKVRFSEDGGGEDFQDEYRYWIDPDTGYIHYLAYNYLTDGGGVRFRRAKNIRKEKGFVFQNYTNYKPHKKYTALDSLPLLFEMGKLIEISQIENKNIQVLLPTK